ncbi:hypothetical protein [Streptomyces sp. NPDC003015]
MTDGLQWLEDPGIDPAEDLIRRLVPGTELRFIGRRTHGAFEADLFQLDRSKPVDTVGVRYGSVGGLSF